MFSVDRVQWLYSHQFILLVHAFLIFKDQRESKRLLIFTIYWYFSQDDVLVDQCSSISLINLVFDVNFDVADIRG